MIMERHFQHELEGLKTMLVKMGSIVEGNVNAALKGLFEQTQSTVDEVIRSDERVNSLEIEIDNAIVDILALHQPVASDLRLIIAAQKINNDLERIGDHAVNIAESARSFLQKSSTTEFLDLPQMAEIAKTMLRDTLDSFIHLDPNLARTVLERDDRIDDLNRAMTTKVIELIRNGKGQIEDGLELIRVSRNLERVADLSTNIAEEVIFHTQARVVKHHAEERGES